MHENAKVSGAMFYSSDDERQRVISLRKEGESSHIATLTANYRLPVPGRLSKLLAIVRHAFSPSYIAGLIDSWRFRGGNIDRLLFSKRAG